jgi:hypothetical protein
MLASSSPLISHAHKVRGGAPVDHRCTIRLSPNRTTPLLWWIFAIFSETDGVSAMENLCNCRDDFWLLRHLVFFVVLCLVSTM